MADDTEVATAGLSGRELPSLSNPPVLDGFPTLPLMKRRLGAVFWVSCGWVGLIILSAIFAGALPLHNPLAQTYMPKLGPSLAHPLGTDELGRDLLSRVIYGARVSLEVGFGSIFLGLSVGGSAGLLAGYLRGKIDAIANGMANIILSFPTLLLLLAIVGFWGRQWWKITIIIGVVSTAPLFRVVRASTLSYSTREFVTAARAIGASHWRIMTRELLPNVLPAALSIGLIAVAIAIVAEGTLSFLGLSVPPPTPTWGNIIAEGQSSLARSDFLITLWPSLAMFMTLLALNLAGDRLQRYFDVREGRL